MARKLKKERWFSLPNEEDIQFLLKPFSVLYLKRIPSDESQDINPDTMWEVFNAVVIDWKGIENENGKPLKCTEENKRKVAEQFNDILMEVFTESIGEITDTKVVTDKESKN